MKCYNEFVMRLRRGEPLAVPTHCLPILPVSYRFDGGRLIIYWQGADGSAGELDTEFDYAVTVRTPSPIGRSFQPFQDAVPLIEPTAWVRDLLLREIACFPFDEVTPFAFSSPFTNMLEVVAKNRHQDWTFLHPWADYQIQEIWPHWPEEECQRLLKEDPEWWEDIEGAREFELHRDGYTILAESDRCELPLADVVPWMASRLGIRSFPDEPLHLRMNANGHGCFSSESHPQDGLS
ncbi:MAG: hypothetical protein HQL80_10415 [Magnetococcales bacterium]|nr:hypothetical protein [Magnetococcales bacterium]